MPIPHAVARANRLVLNPVMRRVAPLLPGFAVVGHRGRRTGAPYETPVVALRDGDRVVIALTYGSEVDWVRNILASEGATLRTRQGLIRVGSPEVRRDDGGVRFPAPARAVLDRLRVREYLHLVVRGG